MVGRKTHQTQVDAGHVAMCVCGGFFLGGVVAGGKLWLVGKLTRPR